MRLNRPWKIVLTACGRVMRSSSAGGVLSTPWTNKNRGGNIKRTVRACGRDKGQLVCMGAAKALLQGKRNGGC